MPQEAWVLKCFSCKKFQVQLKKKAKKWQCKVCGAKQDLMTIFFKGQPSDCRVNAQNLNTIEGEKLENVQEQSSIENQSFNCNSNEDMIIQSENYFLNNDDDDDEFMEYVALDIKERCSEIDDGYSEAILNKENFFSRSENTFNESAIEIQTFKTEENSNGNIEDVFDVNSIDFTIKTLNSNESKNNRRDQVLKLSIFESKSDIDECLDF